MASIGSDIRRASVHTMNSAGRSKIAILVVFLACSIFDIVCAVICYLHKEYHTMIILLVIFVIFFTMAIVCLCVSSSNRRVKYRTQRRPPPYQFRTIRHGAGSVFTLTPSMMYNGGMPPLPSMRPPNYNESAEIENDRITNNSNAPPAYEQTNPDNRNIASFSPPPHYMPRNARQRSTQELSIIMDGEDTEMPAAIRETPRRRRSTSRPRNLTRLFLNRFDARSSSASSPQLTSVVSFDPSAPSAVSVPAESSAPLETSIPSASSVSSESLASSVSSAPTHSSGLPAPIASSGASTPAASSALINTVFRSSSSVRLAAIASSDLSGSVKLSSRTRSSASYSSAGPLTSGASCTFIDCTRAEPTHFTVSEISQNGGLWESTRTVRYDSSDYDMYRKRRDQNVWNHRF
ncbi:unnamed protein product [Caenorhabditis bovis]|uniref:Uncharacterized protein n=1 Tax=Caenorhabditis bovis TaxID=2654633 RepID=A0A8S1F8V9_9PELO|nr:unnamed protein product [Caenorhabditis bovis]